MNKRRRLLLGNLFLSVALMAMVPCIAAPSSSPSSAKATQAVRDSLSKDKANPGHVSIATAAASGTQDGIHYDIKLPAGFEMAQSRSENGMTTTTWINRKLTNRGMVPTIELATWQLPEDLDPKSIPLDKIAEVLLRRKILQWNKFEYGKGSNAKLNGRQYFRNTYIGRKIRWLADVNGIQYVTKIGNKAVIATVQDALSSCDTLTTCEAALKTLKLSSGK